MQNKVLPQMPGFSIFGISGGGKSVAMDRVLAFYPQVIEHRKYKGHSTHFRQLVWMKIDASYDGNIGGMCKQFLLNAEKVLKIDIFSKLKRPSVNDLIFTMAQVASIHKLGCLVIDEIQHISEAKVGPAKVLNFLVTLQNVMKIPIILIGTYKALVGAITKEFRQARRASGCGEIIWDFLGKDDYRDFIRGLFRYQWIRGKVEVTDSLIDAFHKHTAGNVARTVLIYQLCQMEAICIETETIDVDLIELVSSDLPLTGKIIKAYQEKNFDELAQIDDLYYEELSELVTNKYEAILAKKEYERIKLSMDTQKKKKRDELELELSSFLLAMGEPETIVKKYVDYVLEDPYEDIDTKDIKRRLAQLAMGKEKMPKKKKKRKVQVPDVEDFKVEVL